MKLLLENFRLPLVTRSPFTSSDWLAPCSSSGRAVRSAFLSVISWDCMVACLAWSDLELFLDINSMLIPVSRVTAIVMAIETTIALWREKASRCLGEDVLRPVTTWGLGVAPSE